MSPTISNIVKKPRFMPQSARLLAQVKEVLRYHHYAIRTEESYVKWILSYIRFNNRTHPRKMGKAEIEAFLSHLAVDKNCAQATQKQALNAIVFLYKDDSGHPQNNFRVMALLSKPTSATEIHIDLFMDQWFSNL